MFLRTPSVPVLPHATVEYAQQYQDQHNSVLRLYFNQLNNVVGSVTGAFGGQYVDCPNGLFFNTVDQNFAVINTGYPVVYNATYLHNGVALKSGSTSQIQVSVSGVYNFNYTGQVHSDSASAKTLFLWIRRNGTDIGYSTRAETVTTNNGYTGINFGFDIDLAAGEYVELVAATTDTTLHLFGAAASPPHPGIPSSVLSVNFIAPLPDPRPTPP